MKKLITIILWLLVACKASAADPFTLRFTTVDFGSNANILAGYIKQGSTYIDTIGVYGSNDSHLPKLSDWRATSGISSYSSVAADAKMGATRINFSVPNPVVFKWDLKNSAGTLVPNGTYTVNLEIAVESGGRRFYSFNFVKDNTAGTRNVASSTDFTGISIVYAPPPPPNTAPVAQAQSVSAIDGNPLPIVLVATDAESNPVNYNLVSLPSSGRLIGTPPSLTYLPVKGMNGADSFTFNADDGLLTGNTATISISVVFTDSDGDGIPDSWESTHGMTNGVNDAVVDFDHDGASNYAEFMAGTDPTNANSVFEVTVPQVTVGSPLVLQWSSVQDHYYTVQFSTNLLNGWNTLLTNAVATPPMNTYNGSAVQGDSTFYRIRLDP